MALNQEDKIMPRKNISETTEWVEYEANLQSSVCNDWKIRTSALQTFGFKVNHGLRHGTTRNYLKTSENPEKRWHKALVNCP